MKFLILSSLLVSTSITYAAGVCSDLATFSCAPGSYDDGTGTVKTVAELSTEVRGFLDRTRESLRGEVRRSIQQPGSEFFRDNALGLLGLEDSPVCRRETPTSPLPQACEESLVEGISEITIRQTVSPELFPSSNYSYKNPTDLRFIQGDSHFQALVTFVQQKADRELVNHAVIDRVRDQVFPEIKRLIIARIAELNVPENQKRYMTAKINAIQFEGYDCAETNNGQKDIKIDHLLEPNAFYTPLQNTFTFCNGYALRSTSAFSIATSIAHELGHSIDPCSIARGPSSRGFDYSSADINKQLQEHPFTNVLSCLRSPSSIQAVNFQQQQNDQLRAQQAAQLAMYGGNPAVGGPFSGGALPTGGQFGTPNANMTPPANVIPASNGTQPVIAATPPVAGAVPAATPAVAPPNFYGMGAGGTLAPAPQLKAPNFCEGDQITESFSDWMAGEVLPKYIEANYTLTQEQYQLGYANARRMSCNERNQNPTPGDEHPPTRDRINKIILTNPNIRRQMGCTTPSRSTYCDSERQPPAPAPAAGGSTAPVAPAPVTPSTSPSSAPAQPSPTGTVQ